MKKLHMQTPNLTDANIAKLAQLYPNCVTETTDNNGKLKKALDFDLLKQELSASIVEGEQERYRLDWPGKKQALLTANSPINKTLRPIRDGSVNFDSTENLFIEGDNLDALKLLQHTYLGKVKMIYIDPPYNTGKDFIYSDKWTVDSEQWQVDSGQKDDDGNRLVANTETNGRYHSDWLSMMYPRLKLARNLLKDDGVIFISIDDNEQANLKRLCDEVFGEENYRNNIITRRRVKSLNLQFTDNGLTSMNVGFENILIYAKDSSFLMNTLQIRKKNIPIKGKWNVFWSGADRPTMRYELLGFTPNSGQWRWSKEKAIEAVKNYNVYIAEYSQDTSLEDYWASKGKKLKFIRRIPNGKGKNGGVQYWVGPSENYMRTSNWIDLEVSQISKEFNLPFENPKNKELIKTIIELCQSENSIILDFFAGSATTAHAVMQLNAEDKVQAIKDGNNPNTVGNRKFILVQLPELCDEKSEAFKAGYKTIGEISKERIRRAGTKIVDESGQTDLDKGFRVLTVDSSNMANVYYSPDATTQDILANSEGNIKPNRTSEDLLFQVLLDWGVDLSLPIVRETIAGNEIFIVDSNALIACFDKGGNITEDLCKQLAAKKPLRVVFCDAGFKDDNAKINVEQIFKHLSPHTDVKTI